MNKGKKEAGKYENRVRKSGKKLDGQKKERQKCEGDKEEGGFNNTTVRRGL